MLRLICMLAIVAAGALVGGIIGLIGGAIYLETGRTTCEAASCADTIIRGFAPLGAIVGAMIGLGKAIALRAGRA